MKIRLLREDEIQKAVAIVEENYSRRIGLYAGRDLNEMFGRCANRPVYLVAEQGGRIVGLAGYIRSWTDYDVYEIFWVNVVLSTEQRRGIGKKLILRIIRDIHKNTRARLILISTSIPEYYRNRFGFEVIQTFGSTPYHLMTLDLKGE